MSNTPLNRRRGHSRQRSDVSTGRGQEGYGRSGSRHQHTESSITTQTGGLVSTSTPQQSIFQLSTSQEGHPMQALPPSQPQPRSSQERYDTRQQSSQVEPRRYSSGPTDTRLEEKSRTTPPDREEMPRMQHSPPETTKPPR